MQKLLTVCTFGFLGFTDRKMLRVQKLERDYGKAEYSFTDRKMLRVQKLI